MRRILGALAVSVAVVAVARADDPARVTEADLNQKASWGDKADKPVVLENVKFRGYSNPVIDIQNVRSGKLVGPDAKLSNVLPAWKTPAGQDLDRKGRSNVRVLGIARDADGTTGLPQGERYLEVTDVQKLPDDVVHYAELAKKCTTPQQLLDLAKDAGARAETYADTDLRAWTAKTYETALKQQQDALPKGGDGYVKESIRIARGYKALALNPNLGIDLLNVVFSDRDTTAADKAAVQEVLMKELDASQFQGKWVPREVFKKSIGFIAVGKNQQGETVWERRERVEFRREIDKELPILVNDPNPRKGSAFLYEQAAQKGELPAGMYKTEVVRTKGYGYPEFVDRIETKSGATTISWDQWILNSNDGNGVRLYFVNGVLFDTKQKADPWATESK